MRCSMDILFGVLAILAILIEPSVSQRRSRLATGAGQAVEFDCPEEFGYYPHPTDCTQYYVCVFGGALVESCTGGLMYSHELQTCDWPRNVGCGSAGESATISTVRVTDPRTRQTTPTAQGTRAATQVTRDQVQQRQQQEEIAKHQLYADDLGPAEEIETDRQQRVYRGQPSTVGQVARDRDGLRHQPVTNSIPATRTSSADKVAVISFGSQQQTQNTQYSLDPLTDDNFLTNETTHRRKKRQARFRYPARILQIVPSGARVPWPTPPSPSVHSVGSGGNFKYQGNLNRNKPPRLTDTINPPDASFQPALNPNVSPDIRHFRSPEQYGNSKARPPPNSKFSNPDSNYGHRPPINLEPDLNVQHNSNSDKETQNSYNSASSSKHSGGSSPAHSVIIPSSYATFQNLPDVPLHFASPSPALLNNSFVRNIPHTNPVYQNTDEEDNYSYFHLDNVNAQTPHHLSTTPPIPLFSSSPTLSNLITTLKNAEILAAQNPQNNPAAINDQNSLQLLKSLTSLHEVPYNSDGTRLYQIPHPQHQHEIGLNNDFSPAHLFHHIVSQSNPNFPVLGHYQSPSNPHHVPPNNNAGRSPPPATTTQAPFTPNSNPYGIKYENEQKPQEIQQDYRQTTAPHRFAKPQMEHDESQPKKEIKPTAEYPTRPAYPQESENIPSNEYTSSEEDYYDESGEELVNDQYPRPPSQSHFYGTGNKFRDHSNPFADINFDFDKYLDKLRGGYETTVTHPSQTVKQKETASGNYRKPDEYDDYSEEDYEEYEESDEKTSGNNKPHQQYQISPKPLPVQNTNFQSSTESNIYVNTSTTSATTTTAKYRFPVKESSSLPPSNIKVNPTPQTKVPETLTVPFFHGPDGNFYSRHPIQHENSYHTEGSTVYPFPQSQSTHQPNNYKEFHNLQPQIHDVKTNQKPLHVATEPTTTEYISIREKERVPSYKDFRENSQQSKVTTTVRPSSSSWRPVTNLKNQQELYEDFVYTPRPVKNSVHKNRLNNSQSSFESSHIHLLPTKNYRQNESIKETTTHTNVEYSSSSSDLKEYASSTTKYPYKTSKIPNYHYSDIIVQSTRASITPEVEQPIKNPTKVVSHNNEQSSHASRGPSYNSSVYTDGANIFSSVKDTISMMSNTSQSPNNNVNITPSYNKTVSFTNTRHTTLPPLSSDIHTTLKTYTIRRRPAKVPSTTPRYRTRKPTYSPDNTNTGSLASSTSSKPQTVNGRLNRRPTTKNRLRSTTTERTTSTTDSDRNESTDKPKSTVIRHNKKLAPDKDGSRTTNSLRVEPSPASVSYVQQPSLQASPSPPTYNNSQQYDTSQYDPYYSIYDEDVELYRDVDYTQYTGNQGQTNNQQYRGQSPYKQAPQQPEIQSQRNNAYVPQTYNTQDVYTQTAGTQDYNENYNTQLANDQIQYRQQARQPTKAPPRGTPSGRNRGSPAYTASTASDTVNRGTPASVRTRPTLKPSTAIVPKAQEFIDIYRYPPQRPDSIYPTPQVDKTAAKCRKDVCLLPDCYCGGKDIPGGFEPEEIPQMVLLTFDDSANDLNKGLYSDLFETGRKNANGCPISATFYVSHEWTDYSHVQNLYAGGHEIASHSISHSFGEQFSQKKWTREIGGQREILAAYGGVKLEDVRGMRAPFLAIGGNKMFKMLYDSNFTYDSSMPVYENRPPSWPYTLDYKIFHDCMIPPCPTRSYPGVWEVPMVMWQDLNGGRCSMGDACSNPPTADGVYKMLIKNFERHYTTNRAPFGLFYHAAWFTQPHHKEGFEAFLDTIVNMPDVWLVSNWQALQWMRDPTPLSRINSFQGWQCNYPDRPKKCNNPKVCNLWHKSGVRYMRTCQPCPDIYPWTGKTGVRNSRVDNEVIEE